MADERLTVGEPVAHDSAERHAAGSAPFIDDMIEPAGCLHAAIGLSQRAHARIAKLDLKAVAAAPGTVAILTARDIPGVNDIGPVLPGDPVVADGTVEYHGQVMFAVAAETREQARKAARQARVAYKDLPAILTVDEALARESYIAPPLVFRKGDAKAAIAAAPHRLSGRLYLGGQDHFYLEGQIALAVPAEGGDMLIWSSTQHPSEVQKMVARVLDRPANAVTVEVRRMGGGFGGKETQAAQFACIAALLALKTGRPVKLRLDRDDDMITTGKRHDFRTDWTVGFDAQGRISGLDMRLAARCGHSADLSNAVVDRAMFHADNAYHLPAATIAGVRCRTHTVSNTAFRGFGGPQGVASIENVVDEIARHLGIDALEVRKRNLYGGPGRNLTPYHQQVEDEVLPGLIAELAESAEYARRRREIAAFNARSTVEKRGLALTPVKFGISFTATSMNQAGALVHVYEDGSVHLNHGGTEMGQGVNVKVAQIVAEEFQVDLARVKITAANTGKVPNTSATAASAGSDLNGQAAAVAARTIKNRLTTFAAGHFGVPPDAVKFRRNEVRVGDRAVAFAELAHLAHRARISLSATGFYRTPKIAWDRETARGHPFFYFACGAAVSEVAVDTLTGEHRVRRVDILHDCGASLNPAVDLGQIEGGFVQGMGWLTSEELWFDAAGRLATHAPSTYKIPTARDVPADFRVRLLAGRPNREDTIYRSKAVGEPPLMLATSVWLAIKDAVAAAADHRTSPRLDAPATPERILFAVADARARAKTAPARQTEPAE